MSLRTPVVWSDACLLHEPKGEVWVGVTIEGTEIAARAEVIRAALEAAGAPVAAASPHDDTVLDAVHDPGLTEWLRTCTTDWARDGFPSNPGQNRVVPYVFPTAAMLGGMPLRTPVAVNGRAGQFAYDTMTLVGPGTWEAARGAVDAALTAVDLVASGDHDVAYALCRPPGHHATAAAMGGFCYLNNVAIAAQHLLDNGMQRVAVVDVDYHHGNGTQAIFWERGDVFFASLHADPHDDYPFFAGHADEVGAGPGHGCNLNLPLPPGTDGATWLQALDVALARVAAFGAQAVLVSLGVDTFEKDPISAFKLNGRDYPQIGRRIAGLGLPTAYAFEGGYATAEVGTNTVGVIQGHLAAA